jgi:site-specific recombinase XerD
MSKPKRAVPEDLGLTYVTLDVTVKKYPRIKFSMDKSTGEMTPMLEIKRNDPILMDIPILINPKGANVTFANLFLRHIAVTNQLQLKSLKTYSQALLAFYRWLDFEDKTIHDITNEPENGVVYLFRDFLVCNLKKMSDQGEIEGMYSPSTGKTYILAIVKYYEFLNSNLIIQISQNFIPFTYKTVRIAKKASAAHDILSHTKQGTQYIEAQTTGLTKPFGKSQPLPSHHQLSPLLQEDKAIFYSFLNLDESEDVKDLMLYFSTETGLRLEELISFPESEIRRPDSDVMKITISEIRNGCLTKFDKERTLEIRSDVMERLYQYKLSKQRKKSLSKSIAFKHGRLFVKDDGWPYSPNTIQTYFSSLRNKIRLIHLNWYFTVHDLRATFATHWLHDMHVKTNLLFDVLLDDLMHLMGHNDTKETEKYVTYMNTEKNWLEFSQRKNSFADKVVRN